MTAFAEVRHVVCVEVGRKASAVMAKPSGTFTPLLASSRTISPSEAFLPPTSGTSSIVMSANHLMKGWDWDEFMWRQLVLDFRKGWLGATGAAALDR
jgi:hypothetical protein